MPNKLKTTNISKKSADMLSDLGIRLFSRRLTMGRKLLLMMYAIKNITITALNVQAKVKIAIIAAV
jgi:hypothetical protein